MMGVGARRGLLDSRGDIVEPEVIRRNELRNARDLQALRLASLEHDPTGRALVASLHAPLRMPVGRDLCWAALFSLDVDVRLACNVLSWLAERQGHRLDEAVAEQPGKMPHESRLSPTATTRSFQNDDGVEEHLYFGEDCATLLFPVLLWRAYEATRDLTLLARYAPVAERCVDWSDCWGDPDGDGFVEHQNRNPHGLVNHSWRDSRDSMMNRHGQLLNMFCAPQEMESTSVQAYKYATQHAMACISYTLDPSSPRAKQCLEQARGLRESFEREFWVEDEHLYARGRHSDSGEIADAASSESGHALWAGIVSQERAMLVARRLCAPDLRTRWGVRTLSDRNDRYDQRRYHNGNVWPHENTILAAGLLRYGFVAEARRLLVEVQLALDHLDGNYELYLVVDDRPVPPAEGSSVAPNPVQTWTVIDSA